MFFSKELTKHSVRLSLSSVCLCCVTFIPAALAESVAAPTENPAAQTLTIVPDVCPAEPGTATAVKQTPVKSSPILLPAAQPKKQVVKHSDAVITPDPNSPKKSLKISVLAVTSAPVPDILSKPISLDEALEVAFNNSPNIQSALCQIENSRGGIDAAKANFNPSFNLSAMTTLQGPISEMQGIKMTESPSTSASLTFSLPLDISRQLKYTSDAAYQNYQIQYLSMVSISEQLILDVKNAYYNLLRTSGEQTVAQESVNDAQARLDNVKAKYEEGTVPKFDVTSAEVELDNLNQELLTAKNAVYIAQSTLNGILGVDVNYPTQIKSIDIPVTLETVNIPENIQEAYTHRPDLKAAQTSVSLSEVNRNVEKTGLKPSLSISGGPTHNFNPTGFSANENSWSVGMTIKMPIWDGGQTKAKVREATANIQSSMSLLDQTRNSVAQEIRKAALNLQDAALRTKTTSHAVSLAEDALSIATERYNAGVAVLVEVTNARSDLAQARFNYIDAQYDYATALAQLQKATSSQPELNHLQLLADPKNTVSKTKEARS